MSGRTEPDWRWNEFRQVGTDYEDVAEVEAYDRRMGTFRDVDAENRSMLAMLALPPGSAVLEIGCGTGRFARAAAAAGMKVAVADVSKIMLDYVADRSWKDNLPEIAVQHSGFLTLDFPAASFDAAVSGAALHHLPDAWKYVGLLNVARILKPGGRFILRDVVFMVKDGESPETIFEGFSGGFPAMRAEAARHVASEFSTYDWILEGLLARVGVEILSAEKPNAAFAVYHCRKR